MVMRLPVTDSDECSAEERVRLVVNQLEAALKNVKSAGRASRFAEEGQDSPTYLAIPYCPSFHSLLED